MKVIVIYLLILAQPKAQITFNRIYCNIDDFAGYCISFTHQGTFDYESWSCQYTEFGSGKYMINKDSLNLYYQLSDSTAKVTIEKDTSCQNIGNIKLTIQLIHKNKSELSHMDLILKDSLHVMDSTRCNIDGIGVINCPKSNQKYILAIHYLGKHLISEIYVRPETCQLIKFEVKNDSYSRFIESHTIKKYKINKINRSRLILSSNTESMDLHRIYK